MLKLVCLLAVASAACALTHTPYMFFGVIVLVLLSAHRLATTGEKDVRSANWRIAYYGTIGAFTTVCVKIALVAVSYMLENLQQLNETGSRISGHADTPVWTIVFGVLLVACLGVMRMVSRNRER